mmetsp:Transcript_8847/g.21622  ORF Transcript_8847/g.21622 Transcript_8847/m.21622 type:complete len:203 (-) Transcript_8847:636-1244(-)
MELIGPNPEGDLPHRISPTVREGQAGWLAGFAISVAIGWRWRWRWRRRNGHGCARRFSGGPDGSGVAALHHPIGLSRVGSVPDQKQHRSDAQPASDGGKDPGRHPRHAGAPGLSGTRSGLQFRGRNLFRWQTGKEGATGRTAISPKREQPPPRAAPVAISGDGRQQRERRRLQWRWRWRHFRFRIRKTCRRRRNRCCRRRDE